MITTERVVVTRAFVGIATMQVCAAKDAADEEILAVCNATNLAGTEQGWVRVCRTPDDGPAPVPCADDPERTHFIVAC